MPTAPSQSPVYPFSSKTILRGCPAARRRVQPRAARRSPRPLSGAAPGAFPRGVRGGSRRQLGESRGLPAEGPSPTRAAFSPPFSSSSSCCCCRRRRRSSCRRCPAPLRLASPEPAALALPILPGFRSPGPAGGECWGSRGLGVGAE